MNLQQAVPFFAVSDIDASLRFYIDGLGFSTKHKWIDDGKLRWCWLERDKVSLMLQEYRVPKEKGGAGVTICITCEDALKIYHEVKARGVKFEKKPFVGNNLWVVGVTDPDGYRIDFESPTDVEEDTEYAE